MLATKAKVEWSEERRFIASGRRSENVRLRRHEPKRAVPVIARNGRKSAKQEDDEGGREREAEDLWGVVSSLPPAAPTDSGAALTFLPANPLDGPLPSPVVQGGPTV